MDQGDLKRAADVSGTICVPVDGELLGCLDGEVEPQAMILRITAASIIEVSSVPVASASCHKRLEPGVRIHRKITATIRAA
jgi:hypothetical protein